MYEDDRMKFEMQHDVVVLFFSSYFSIICLGISNTERSANRWTATKNDHSLRCPHEETLGP